MQVLLSIIIWVIFGLSTAYFAQKKGRDPAIWFIIGLLLGLIGLLLVIFLPAVAEEEEDATPKDLIEISPYSTKENYSHSEYLPKGYENYQWFYLSDERRQMGPLTFVELKDKWREGIIDSDSLVWCEGMDNWRELNDLGLLNNLPPKF